MRSLWTAASGMKSQQINIDTISHNLANVNTTAFKANRAEFKDLFYANLKRANNPNGEGGRPINLEIGHGSMPIATKRNFGNGSFIHTEGTFDVALNGEGFFEIELPNGERSYTRDGSFKLSNEGDGLYLVTSEGYYVLGEDDRISFEEGYTDFAISEQGYITAENEDGEVEEMDARISLFKFPNTEGLEARGSNLYDVTISSGEPELMDPEDEGFDTQIVQGYLEASNVQVVDEMVKMITAQRAYEINSKAITTSDEMMQIANNLKR